MIAPSIFFQVALSRISVVNSRFLLNRGFNHIRSLSLKSDIRYDRSRGYIAAMSRSSTYWPQAGFHPKLQSLSPQELEYMIQIFDYPLLPTEDIEKVNMNINRVRNDIKEAKEIIDNLSIQQTKLFGEEEISMVRDDKLRNELIFSDKKISLMNKINILRKKEISLMTKERSIRDEKEAILDGHIPDFVLYHLKNNEPRSMKRDTNKLSIPISQDFLSLRDDLVVDKTHFIPDLLKCKRCLFFRPPRFGKSTILSMLKYFFYGLHEGFKGFSLYKKKISLLGESPSDHVWNPTGSDHNFPPFPVIHLDFRTFFSIKNLGNEEALKESFLLALSFVGLQNNVDIQDAVLAKLEVSHVMHLLVNGLSSSPLNKWKKVVILIDGYDFPFDKCKTKLELRSVTNVVASLFRAIESCDGLIYFAFVTGAKTHGAAELYSGAYNFVDISNDLQYHELCGFNEEEAVDFLERGGISCSPELLNNLQHAYSGYSWLTNEKDFSSANKLYNPSSIANYIRCNYFYHHPVLSSRENIYTSYPYIFTIRFPYKISLADFKRPRVPFSHTDDDYAKFLFECGYATIVDVKTENNAPSSGTVTLDWACGYVRENDKFERKLFISDMYLPRDAAKSWEDTGDFVPLCYLVNTIRASKTFSSYNRAFDSEAKWSDCIRYICGYFNLDVSVEPDSSLGRSDLILTNKRGDLVIMELKLVKDINNDNDKQAATANDGKNFSSTEISIAKASNSGQVEKAKHKRLLKKAADDASRQIIMKRYFDSSFFRNKLKDSVSVRFIEIAISECSFGREISLIQEVEIDKSHLLEYSSVVTIKSPVRTWL